MRTLLITLLALTIFGCANEPLTQPKDQPLLVTELAGLTVQVNNLNRTDDGRLQANISTIIDGQQLDFQINRSLHQLENSEVLKTTLANASGNQLIDYSVWQKEDYLLTRTERGQQLFDVEIRYTDDWSTASYRMQHGQNTEVLHLGQIPETMTKQEYYQLKRSVENFAQQSPFWGDPYYDLVLNFWENDEINDLIEQQLSSTGVLSAADECPGWLTAGAKLTMMATCKFAFIPNPFQPLAATGCVAGAGIEVTCLMVQMLDPLVNGGDDDFVGPEPPPVGPEPPPSNGE